MFNVPADVVLEVFARSNRGDFQDALQVVDPLEVGARREITLEIAVNPKNRMYVRVVDLETGIGIARAKIERSFEERPDLETDAGGRCVLDFVPQKTFSNSVSRGGRMPSGFCRVHAEGYSVAGFRESEGHEREELALEIRLSKTAALTLTILNRVDLGARAYEVRAEVGAGSLVQNSAEQVLDYDYSVLNFKALCDGGGSVRLEALPANVPLKVAVFRNNTQVRALAEPLQLKPGEERRLDFDLGSPCHLHGHVIDATGAGVADVDVWLKPQPSRIRLTDGNDCVAKVRSDASGNFDIGQIPVGRFWLCLAPISYTLEDKQKSLGITAAPLDFEIVAGETDKDVELRANRGMYIRGRVLRPDGTAMDSSSVAIYAGSTQLHHSANAVCLFDGSFVLGPLLAGTYNVVARENVEFADSQSVEVVAGAMDVVLTLRGRASLAGRVVEVAGGPGVRAMLLNHPEDALGITSTQNTLPDGGFEYRMLNPGRLSLTAYTADGRFGILPSINLASGEQRRDVEVLLSPGAKLRVRASNEAIFTRIQVFQDGVLVAEVFTDGNSTDSICVPIGELTVRVSLGGKPFEKTLRISAGEEREVVFGP
jgi:hypothetical protein